MSKQDPMISVPVPPNPQPLLLVVDDDAEVRGSIATLFSGVGYEVTTAKNGLEALDQMARRRADVVLTDIYMPDADGFELITALRKRYGATRVAAMSGGHTGFNPLIFANKLGADLVIAKPFRCSQLVEAIDGLIRCYRRLPA